MKKRHITSKEIADVLAVLSDNNPATETLGAWYERHALLLDIARSLRSIDRKLTKARPKKK